MNDMVSLTRLDGKASFHGTLRRDHRNPGMIFFAVGRFAACFTPQQAIAFANQIADILESEQDAA